MQAAALGGILLALAIVSSAAAQAPGSPSIRVTEFISNPEFEGNDGAYEWVELHNTTTETIDLRGWTIADDRLDDSLDGLVIPAGAYAVIAGKAVEFDPSILVFRMPDGAIGGGLNNGGDTIRLVDPSGSVVDEVQYGNGAPLLEPGVGRTLGRDDTGGWRVTLDPTPGQPNAFVDAANFATAFPVPIEYRIADHGTRTIAWLFMGACAGAGIAGGSILLYRSRQKSGRNGR